MSARGGTKRDLFRVINEREEVIQILRSDLRTAYNRLNHLEDAEFQLRALVQETRAQMALPWDFDIAHLPKVARNIRHTLEMVMRANEDLLVEEGYIT